MTNTPTPNLLADLEGLESELKRTQATLALLVASHCCHRDRCLEAKFRAHGGQRTWQQEAEQHQDAIDTLVAAQRTMRDAAEALSRLRAERDEADERIASLEARNEDYRDSYVDRHDRALAAEAALTASEERERLLKAERDEWERAAQVEAAERRRSHERERLLREALEPFAKEPDSVLVWDPERQEHDRVFPPDCERAPCFDITYGDLRRASLRLQPEGEGK